MEQMRLPAELVGDLHPSGINARAEIVRLRAAGYGAAETARSLNRRGIPTPTGRGRWHPETVRRHADPAVAMRWRMYIADYRARHHA